ncbi:hypothetical protein FHV99_004668 [Ochrobactrum sp. P20RRXII]|nr:hypothetical protein [Ochrobactrum sp. P20RRXII]NIH77416.1 hypothetical protein [Ochrobactrum sp. P20RRXII]
MRIPVQRSKKQKEIMSYILKGMDAGTPETYESLAAKLSYGPSYDALRVSIAFLKKHSMVEVRRVGHVAELLPTSESYYYFRKLT